MEEIKKIDIIKFIEDGKGNNYVSLKKEVKTLNYLPILKKEAICRNLVKTTCGKVDESGNVIGLDLKSNVEHVLYQLTLIDSYTNLTVDFTAITTIYDMLMTNTIMLGSKRMALLTCLIESIRPEERTEFERVFNAIKNDFIKEQTSIETIVGRQVTRFGVLIGTVLGSGLEVLENDSETSGTKINGAASFLSSLLKKK